jgi:hypothetical protein
MFETMDVDWDLLPGQPDPENAESMLLWLHSFPQDPIDECDYLAKEETEYYADLAFLACMQSPGFLSNGLEDRDEP